MDRSNILFLVEKALKDRGFRITIRSVKDFRKVFPSCPLPTNLEGLQAIVREVPTLPIATLKRWRRRRRVGKPAKSRISEDQIRSLRLLGDSVASIARSAGVTRSRIYQILKEVEDGEIRS